MVELPIIKLEAESALSTKMGQRSWLALLFVLIAIELAVLSESPPHDFWFACLAAAPSWLCQFYSLAIERAIFFLGISLIFTLAQPSIPRILFDDNQTTGRRRFWLCLQLAGFGLILLPWFFTSNSASSDTLSLAFVLWMIGGLLAAFGSGFTLASPRQWQRVAIEIGPFRLFVLAIGLFAPEIVRSAHGIWYIEPLTRSTFQLVVATLDVFGVAATAVPETYTLATKDFAVEISWMCSGVEGFALVGLFLICYFYAFAKDLRFPNVWVLLPISLILSWLLNVARIAALFAIGDRVSPNLAVNGFHSHAGWLMFSLLALSIIAVSRTIPWLRSADHETSADLPIAQDWVAARIVPFAVFMGTALLLSTFTEIPDIWYFVKLIFIMVALALFLPLYARIDWRLDPLSLSVGAAVGVFWIATSSGLSGTDDPLTAALASLPTSLLALWILVRMIGSIIVIPFVEELFFRAYIIDRLDSGGSMMRVVALCVSTGLFSIFHGRWLLAGIAGLVYGLLYLRRKKISDAIIAHAASNAVIALFAFARMDWSLI
jgi:uncharacterized protein